MKRRTIEKIIAPPPPHMVGDGFRMHGFFPGDAISKKRMSPFFLMDYNSKIDFSPAATDRGVGVHPHRGFETVTIVYHGKIAHHDSLGNSGEIGPGEVQWMTAGSGLLHKEYHHPDFSRTGGPFQMVQLWVNLPAAYKMTAPKYQDITRRDISSIKLAQENGLVEIIAGDYNTSTGPANTFSPLHLSNTILNPGGMVSFNFPSSWNAGMLVIEGEVMVNTVPVTNDHFVLFANDGEEFHITAAGASKILVMAGEPIHEPIAQYGPFLMNTWEEVEQAITDVSRGHFGSLE